MIHFNYYKIQKYFFQKLANQRRGVTLYLRPLSALCRELFRHALRYNINTYRHYEQLQARCNDCSKIEKYLMMGGRSGKNCFFMITCVLHYLSKFGNIHCIQHSKIHRHGKCHLLILFKAKTINCRCHPLVKTQFLRKQPSNFINRNRS